MNVEATFVLSAASARDLPQDGLAEIAFVGRSNVGKSSLINALVGQRVARTSAVPGKTRLANVYRVARASGQARNAAPFYLVDLPGYGYARGGSEGFDELARAIIEQRTPGVLLLVDARHPGLKNDKEAWRWLAASVERRALVATKLDKLSRAERLRAMNVNEAAFEHPVLPVSARTGEGLDELWILIDRLLNNQRSPRPRHSPPPLPHQKS